MAAKKDERALVDAERSGATGNADESDRAFGSFGEVSRLKRASARLFADRD